MSQLPVLIILAGGASSRMWPLREKSLLHFGSDPLLISQLRSYQSLGFHKAIIVANPDNEADIRGLVDGITNEISVEIAVQPEAVGMGDALLRTAPLLANDPHTAIYITQVHDVVEDSLHADMIGHYHKDPAGTYIAGVEMDDYFPGGYLVVDDAGRISGIVEKPAPDQRPSNLVNIVAHIHADAERLFSAIRAEYERDVPSDDHYERAMDQLMKQTSYQVVPYQGPWDALKYPWHVLDIMNSFLDRIKGQTVAPSAFIAKTASLVGDVYIGENVKVFPGAAVVGPAYIGDNTIVGNNALVRNSMVLNGCEVGFTSEVARSYVAEGCAMHACRVLDSVFAPGVNFSAGCTTANLRIDHGEVKSTVKGQRLGSGRNKFGAVIGEKAFLGVDVMTMPGVKIAAGAQIGPGVHVEADVPNAVRMYVKQEIVVSEIRS